MFLGKTWIWWLITAGWIYIAYELVRSFLGLNGMTWKGHEFLDAIRSPKIWKFTKEGLQKAGVAGVEIAWGIARAEMKRMVQEKLSISF